MKKSIKKPQQQRIYCLLFSHYYLDFGQSNGKVKFYNTLTKTYLF